MIAWLPDIIVVCLGTNDSKPDNWFGIASFEKSAFNFVKKIQVALPNAKVILCTPPPVFRTVATIDAAVVSECIVPAWRKMAKRDSLQLVDLHGAFRLKEELFLDGVHMSSRGARLMALRVYRAVRGVPNSGGNNPIMNRQRRRVGSSMKIAVWHNLSSGGGKRALYHHCNGLAARGHKVEVWCPDTADRSYLPLDEFGTVHVLPLAWRWSKAGEQGGGGFGWVFYDRMVAPFPVFLPVIATFFRGMIVIIL